MTAINDEADPDDRTLAALAGEVAELLCERRLMLVTAESCTGGWIAKCCTDLPGSSHWFERGFVTYTNEAKMEALGVEAATLQAHGAVSEATVTEMAAGALRQSRAQVSVAVSGIAGPGGGRPDKPVGTVCFGWALAGKRSVSRQLYILGDREQIRRQAVAEALRGVLDVVRAG
ncbi:MAG TPA: CinA family protein [Gammaproteobacteria bacterium]